MRYKIKCLKCGAIWLSRGSYDPEVNAVELDESLHDGQCDCGEDTEIIDEEAEEFEDNVI